jgi:hypothetical protein
MILGRLAGMFGPEVSSKAMFISPKRVATIFVWSDVCTFLIQAVGGSMLTSSKINTINLGNTVRDPRHSDRISNKLSRRSC